MERTAMLVLPAAHRSASSRDVKKKMWWQKVVQIASTELRFSLSGLMSTVVTTAPGGLTSSTRSGLTVNRIFSPLSGDVDSMMAVLVSSTGRNNVSCAHHADIQFPSTCNRWLV